MNPVDIEEAKALAKKLGARGVIILAFDDDRISGASYGRTKKDCKSMGRLMDLITDPIEDGDVEVWP